MRTAVARHHYVHSRGRCASDVIDIEFVLIFSDAHAGLRRGDPRGACPRTSPWRSRTVVPTSRQRWPLRPGRVR
jgi:hypothetical protein